MTKNAIGIVELSSIAGGYASSDAMLKTANVDMLLARTICSGKYMVMVGGDVADVQSSVAAGVEASEGAIIDSAVLSNIDPSVFPAISGAVPVAELDALGIELVGDDAALGKGRVLAQLVEPFAQRGALAFNGDQQGEAASAGASDQSALGQIAYLRVFKEILQRFVGGIGVQGTAQLPVEIG